MIDGPDKDNDKYHRKHVKQRHMMKNRIIVIFIESYISEQNP
jgi:hypothetical protein